MKKFIIRWAIMTIAIMIVANMVSGIAYDSLGALVKAALLMGILNMIVRPILIVLTLPLTILTMGIFLFILNGILLYFVGSVIDGIYVETLSTAILGSILISIVAWVLNKLVGDNKKDK